MSNDAVAKTVKATTNRLAPKRSPSQIVNQDELTWWPYQSLSRALLQTHRNTVAFMKINRTLLDDLNEINRRHQDLVFDVSEKLFEASTRKRGDQIATLQPEDVTEVYQVALSGIREFGQAVADAHVRSIEALWRHAIKTNGNETKHSLPQAAE